MAKKKNLDKDGQAQPPKGCILAIDTATDVSSVALVADGKVLALQEIHANRSHAKLVTVMIGRLLSDLEMQPADLAAVAVTGGPGSYTGLRVGLSVAKGLCMALDKPLISVGSLEALAWGQVDLAKKLNVRICAMIDARRMEVFCQFFDSECQPLNEPKAKVLDENSFVEELNQGSIIFVGDGVAKCQQILGNSPNAILLPNALSSASNFALPAALCLQENRFEDLLAYEPFYLKDFVATISKKKLL